MRKEILEEYLEKKKRLEHRAIKVEEQIEETKIKLEQLNQEKEQISQKLRRAESINLKDELICPHCLIDEEASIPLSPIGGDTEVDNFRCKKCGFEISLSI